MSENSDRKRDFERHAARRRTGLARELWDFLKHNKKWWLLPILIVILLMGVLVLLSSASSVAPWIYAAW